ncbi:VWA domain-containing protein [Longimicrobium terrae]|uniref:Nitric oxide reductase NorD protein n=1 Tax=Longimicrobium terrae TaxID=1639882 RepID=A0A841GQZ4_9BACT|nr:nitric oxide reductase NorD protein [Longimicrobium terrae]MBB6069490.1 nitric oxide reductase NorD protein [Longimicrobium terrae]NNC31707.1 VWA domain-containing protein [Longimicrobium terrae]
MPRASLVQRAIAALRSVGRAPEPPSIHLDDVRRRLELLLAALYEREIPVATAKAEPGPGLLRRTILRAPAHLRTPRVASSTDGVRILLPATIATDGDAEATLRHYRVLAMEQAERLTRGTLAHLPAGATRLERDLYLLAESAAVDAEIVRRAPGLRGALVDARVSALAARPPVEGMTEAEREVESLLRAALATEPGAAGAELPDGADPAASLAWAREHAARLEARGRYRGVPDVEAWGTAPLTTGGGKSSARREQESQEPPPLAAHDAPNLGRKAPMMMMDADPAAATEERKGKPGPNAQKGPAPASPAQPAKPAGGGARDGAPRSSGDDEDFGKGLDAGAAAPATDAPEVEAAPAVAASGAAVADAGTRSARGIDYPEWDCELGMYTRPGATVRPHEAELGDAEWAERVLAWQAPVVRRLRVEFERLRARRIRLTAQKDGDELDLAACVRALVDRRTGHAPDDRMYMAVRPARRELSILLLVDVSGSTTERLGAHRIIDLEKLTILLASEAFDALGDRYAIQTFSSKTARNVRIRTLKDFGERNGETVRRRIAALEPEAFTRMGAAVRHASAQLARQGTSHQLLLIVSDGRPNDDDHYKDTFAVEDARQAIAEARQLGIVPFCLTIDRKGASYLPRIFGAAGHVILRQPDQMPLALTRVVRQLLRA